MEHLLSLLTAVAAGGGAAAAVEVILPDVPDDSIDHVLKALLILLSFFIVALVRVQINLLLD